MSVTVTMISRYETVMFAQEYCLKKTQPPQPPQPTYLLYVYSLLDYVLTNQKNNSSEV